METIKMIWWLVWFWGYQMDQLGVGTSSVHPESNSSVQAVSYSSLNAWFLSWQWRLTSSPLIYIYISSHFASSHLASLYLILTSHILVSDVYTSHLHIKMIFGSYISQSYVWASCICRSYTFTSCVFVPDVCTSYSFTSCIFTSGNFRSFISQLQFCVVSLRVSLIGPFVFLVSLFIETTFDVLSCCLGVYGVQLSIWFGTWDFDAFYNESSIGDMVKRAAFKRHFEPLDTHSFLRNVLNRIIVLYCHLRSTNLEIAPKCSRCLRRGNNDRSVIQEMGRR